MTRQYAADQMLAADRARRRGALTAEEYERIMRAIEAAMREGYPPKQIVPWEDGFWSGN